MKKVALESIHKSLGAKMAPFAGYNMPIQYEGLKFEHEQVRAGLGVFDVSHMGEFFVSGPNAMDFLQRVTSNDVAKLFNGKAQYSCLPNNDGGVVDDLIVYQMAENEFMLVVNASNIEKDYNWLQSHLIDGVELVDRSDEYSLLAVQGPKAIKAMQTLTQVDLAAMKFYTFELGTFAGIDNVIISATGYTGSGGFELYVKNENIEQLWAEVFKAGEDYNIKPIGLGARDTLRLEMGYCLYGNDIDDTTSPLEAGLGWITKFSKDFVNSENLQKQKEAGVERSLVGFVMEDRGIPRQGYLLKNAQGEEIGKVTSGTQSPSLGIAIGMGYVKVDYKQPDTEIYVEVRSKLLKAKVKKPPFYKA